MDREQDLIEALTNYPGPPDDDAFVQAHVDEALLSGRVAVRMWTRGNTELSFNALSYLSSIGELAITPVIEGPLRDDPTVAVRALHLLADAELSLRQRVLKHVDLLLDDKRQIPPRPFVGPAPESPYLPRRVCDEAYVAIRRLVHFGEPRVSQQIEAEQFFAVSERKRDEEIAFARSAGSFRRAVRPDDEGDD
jgi:hypothetical protein